VNASERFQFFIVETLDADGEAVDARRAVSLEAFEFNSAGISLEGDLDFLIERQARAYAGQQAVDSLGREQARRATTDKNGVNDPAPHPRQVLLEIAQQCVDVFLFRNLGARLVRIEIAVRALAHAPRDMHVERQRRKRNEGLHERRRTGKTAIISAYRRFLADD
jgi:hypothetical protein